jgi:hypothetical protein
VFEIRAGQPPVQRLAKAGQVMAIAPGPDGTVLARVIRTSAKEPILVAWWPASLEYAAIPGTMFGYPGKDSFATGQHGYNATSKLVWGFEPIRKELRAIQWDAIAALPRLGE